MKASTKCVLAFTFSCHLLAPADPTKQAPIYMSHAPTTKGKGKVNRCQFQAILGKQNERNLFLAEFEISAVCASLCLAVTFIFCPTAQAKGKLEERVCTRLTRDFDSRLHGQPSLSSHTFTIQ